MNSSRVGTHQKSVSKARKSDPVKEKDKFDALWEAFEALKKPTRAQMDRFLEDVLRLPPETVDWPDVMDELAVRGHPDLAGVFRAIATAVPHTKKTRMYSFYWGAAERFSLPGLTHLLPEVVEGFCKLDVKSYDADALRFIEGHLLAEGLEAETLRLAEHFLPIMCKDASLTDLAMPEHSMLILNLRIGRALRAHSAQQPPKNVLKTVERDLKQGLEEEIKPECFPHSAAVICDPRPLAEVLTPELLEVRHTETLGSDPAASQEYLRLYGVLIRVARDAWQNEGIAPGRAFHGLVQVLQSIYDDEEDEDWPMKSRKRKKRNVLHEGSSGRTLLSYLDPVGIERRVARSCAGLIDTIVPFAHVQLDAYEVLRRFAVRYGLIGADEATVTENALGRMREELGIQ